MKDKRRCDLLKLPKAMFIAEGDLDYDLIKTAIDETVCKPSAFTKIVCGFLNVHTPENYEDRVRLIASNIHNKAFQKQWYNQERQTRFRKNNWVSFFKLINTYVSKKDTFFKEGGKEYGNNYFKRIGSREFLDLEEIPSLIVDAEEQGANERWLAINLWTHVVVGELNNYEENMDYYNRCLEKLKSQKKTSYIVSVINLFSPIESSKKILDIDNKSTTHNSIEDIKNKTIRSPEKQKKGKLSGGFESNNHYFDIDEIALSYSLVKKDVNILIDYLASIEKNINEINTVHVNELATNINQSKRVLEEKIIKYNADVVSRVNDIQSDYLKNNVYTYTPSNDISLAIEKWINKEKSVLDNISAIESKFRKIQKFNIPSDFLNDYFNNKKEICTINDFLELISKLYLKSQEEYQLKKKTRTILTRIKQQVNEKKSLITLFHEEDFIFLLQNCEDFKNIDPFLQGAIIRYYLEKEELPYDLSVEYIISLLIDNHQLVLPIMSVLSKNQLEKIWSLNDELKPWVQFSLIISYYVTSEINGESVSEIWCYRPLLEFTRENNLINDRLSKLFSSMYILSATNNISNTTRLHYFIINLPKNDTISTIENDFNHKFIILSYPKNVYGKVTSYVHNKFFKQIDKSFVNKSYDEIYSITSSLANDYDIDNIFKDCIDNSDILGIKKNNSEIKKHLNRYITERLNFLNKFLYIKKPSSDIPKRIKNFISLIEGFNENTTDKIDLTVKDFFITIKDGCKLTQHSVLYNNEQLSSFLSLPCYFQVKIEYWRCFEALSSQKEVCWEDYLKDALSNWVDPSNLSPLLDHWKEENNIETLSQASKLKTGILFSNGSKVADYVSKEEDKLKQKYGRKLKEITAKSINLSPENRNLIKEELASVEIQLEHKQWSTLSQIIEEVDVFLDSSLKELGDENERDDLILKIKSLGGNVQSGFSLNELERLYHGLLKKTENKRQHLSFFYKIKDQLSLSKDIQDKVILVIQNIEHINYLPTQERSEYLLLLFVEILKHPLDVISQPEKYSSKYITLLKKIIILILEIILSKKWLIIENSKEQHILEGYESKINEQTQSDAKPSLKTYEIAYSWLEKSSSEIITRSRKEASHIEIITSKPSLHKIDVSAKDIDKDTTKLVDDARSYLIEYLEKLVIKHNLPEILINKDPLNILYTKDWSDIATTALSRYLLLKRDNNLQDHDITGISFSIILSNLVENDNLKFFLSTYFLTENTKLPTERKKVGGKLQKLYAHLFIALLLSYKADFLKNIDTLSFDQIVVKLDEKIIQQKAIAWLTKILGQNNLNNGSNSYLLDALWGLASNQKKSGAEYRAWIMLMCQKGEIYGALSSLLQRDPNKLPKRRAELASQLFRSSLENIDNQLRMEKFLITEKSKFPSKPFSIFVDKILLTESKQSNTKTSIQLIEKLRATCIKKKLWTGVIEITPTLSDPPMDILLRVSPSSGVLFSKKKKTSIEIEGPFLKNTSVPIELFISKEVTDKARIEVVCSIKTVQELNYEHTEVWSIDLIEDPIEFIKPSNETIESCFNHFPSKPMRGEDYIPRDKDEKSIEEILFSSNQAESLWITSPRRSGKTTMLYRILDAFSYRGKGEGGDIILYFTLAKKFTKQKEFNTFIFNRIKDRENRDITKYIGEIGDIKTSLDFSNDIDIFLDDLTTEILERYPTSSARVYYVFDEIDKFAEMYISGGEDREKAKEMMWQFRHFISNQDKAGIVFSGSHVAKSFFVEDNSSPFYNSIKSILLTPFNLKTDTSSDRTKQILQPKSLAESFQISKDVINHFLWITAGIPYYMKLLAGATFVEATHSQIFEADVNKGLRNMLQKETGLRNIDTLEDPGADELRTLYTKTNDERILINATLLSLAEIKSPVSRIGVNRGELWSQNSRIFVEFAIQKELIEKALNQALSMGVLRPSKNNINQIEFSIPMLGESLRMRSHSLWAAMSRRLKAISEKYEMEEL